MVSSAVAKPAYWRIVQNRLRYIVGWTPRVNGYSPGSAEVAVLVEAGGVGGGVQVADVDAGGGLERLAALRGALERLGPERLAPAVPGRVRALADGAPSVGRSGHSEDDQDVAEFDGLRRRPTATRSTVPARGARSSFSIFIASTARSRWPAVDGVPRRRPRPTRRVPG